MEVSQAPGSVVPGSGALVTLNEQVRRVSMDNARKSRDYDEEPSREYFLMSHGLSTAEAQDLLNKWGPNEVVGKAASKWWIFFRQVMPVNEERFSSQP
jgi:hypothetical protein